MRGRWQGLISSITGVADAPHLFMTASFDNTVRLWDVRRPGGSGTFGAESCTS